MTVSKSIMIRLVGAERYNYKNELFEKGKAYRVGEAKALNLLRKINEVSKMPWFVRVESDVKLIEPEPEEEMKSEELEVVDAVSTEDITEEDDEDDDNESEEVGEIDFGDDDFSESIDVD